MSKEIVRQIASVRFTEFTGLTADRKRFPNQPKIALPKTGMHAELGIEFVLHDISSIGSEPCTRRRGVFTVLVTEQLDSGIKGITMLTDAIEEWFGMWQKGSLWTAAANTIYHGEDKLRTRYTATVVIPFTYDQS